MTKDYAAPDWRGLCEELLDEVLARPLILDRALIDRARAALAQPEPEGRPAPAPAGERQAAPAPVAVSERLPQPEDCDAQGRCWFLCFPFDYSRESWSLEDRTYGCNTGFTHWLPANALPLPSGEVEHG